MRHVHQILAMAAYQRRTAFERAQRQLRKTFLAFSASDKNTAHAAADESHIVHLQEINSAVSGAGNEFQRLLMFR
ncbi:hypothetical protein D3C86_2187160 [compost metagenome]